MASPKKKKSKSIKSDGTPKKRWSAAERAARGHKPRRSGGVRNRAAQEPGREDRRFDAPERTRTGGWGGSRDDRSNRGGRDSYREDRRGDSRDDRFQGRREDRRFQDGTGGRNDRFERGRGDSRGYRGRDEERGFPRDRRDGGRGQQGRFRNDDRFGDERFSRADRYQANSRRSWRDDRREPGADNWSGQEREDRGYRREDRFRGDNRGAGRRDGHRGPAREHLERPFLNRGFEPRGRGRRDGESRGFDYRGGERRGYEYREEFSSADQDQMSWQAHTVEVEVTAEHETSGFAALGVATPLVAALEAQGITEPFPIQSATIADAVAGRDVLGRGRTGSGKTLAFGLPMLTRLADGEITGTPRAVILTPTRELALQIADNLSPLAAVMGLDLYLVAGGMAYGPQIKAFQRGVDVVVATPGRLIDLLEQGAVDLSQVEIAVLDEADHMSDLGFLPAVTTILDAVPEGGQRLLFSATLDGAVDKLVKRYLNDPVTHEVDSGKASVTTMTHHVLHLAPHHKNQTTAEIANREGKTVIFARTQMGSDRIAGQLRQAGVLAGALHGGLTQGARARILAAFKAGEVPVLVATDVAARGIHVDDVTLVLQVDPPRNHKDYLHRAGRTARAGEAGAVVSLVLPHQRKQMRRLVGQAGVKVEPLDVQPGSEELTAATGARPVTADPIDEADYLAIIAPKPQQRRPKRKGGWQRGPRRGHHRD